MTEYEEYLLIPKDRIGVLIGEGGEVRRRIEKNTGVKLEINSKTGEVNLDRSDEGDAFKAMKAKDIVTAIARGFSPERAFRLLDDDAYLELVDIKDYVGDSEKAIRRHKGRIIGTNGKTRRLIEEMTQTEISVKGKHVAIIGKLENANLAMEGIMKLLGGTPHGDVYKFIQNRAKELVL
jgi:ribosomal RNA assembly protein